MDSSAQRMSGHGKVSFFSFMLVCLTKPYAVQVFLVSKNHIILSLIEAIFNVKYCFFLASPLLIVSFFRFQIMIIFSHFISHIIYYIEPVSCSAGGQRGHQGGQPGLLQRRQRGE